MSVTDAQDALLHYRIHRAPVVDDAAQMIGTISVLSAHAGPEGAGGGQRTHGLLDVVLGVEGNHGGPFAPDFVDEGHFLELNLGAVAWDECSQLARAICAVDRAVEAAGLPTT